MAETGERLATLETQMKELMGNGQPGVIAELRTAQRSFERRFWIAIGALGALSMLAGSGTISVKALLEMFK